MKYFQRLTVIILAITICNPVCAQGPNLSAVNSPLLTTSNWLLNPARGNTYNTTKVNDLSKNETVKDSVGNPIPIWPAKAPGDQENIAPEKNTSKPDDGKPGGRDVIRLANVSNPTITVYHPAKQNDTHTAVVVCPGGGYNILAMDLEGTEVCEWFNSIGVTAILLKYRVPRRTGIPVYQAPLQDAQRALGLARFNASKWGINPDHIGIMGFSAGGHLSAALSNNYVKRTYPPVDAADQVSCRPNFAILVYPAYLTDSKDATKLAPEMLVTDQTPPSLLLQTEDDPVNAENSLVYYLALKKAKVSAEMHLYSTGGHGYGFRDKTGGTSRFPRFIEQWLADNKF